MATDPAVLLAKVEAAIEARLDGGAIESYTIRGRNIKYISISELRSLRTELRREAEASTRTDGLPFGYGVKDQGLAAS